MKHAESVPEVDRETIALILFIHVGFLEYLSFKQFKLIVKMTRIESGVTIPKGLFTLYLNIKKVTAKHFLAAIVLNYIIYGDRTIIGFVGFIANLLNRPTDSATVSVRKTVTFRSLVK
jgi:hypothetical protein